MADNVYIYPPSGKVTFSSYESVTGTDTFVQPESFLRVPWLAPYYWHSLGLVGRYVSD